MSDQTHQAIARNAEVHLRIWPAVLIAAAHLAAAYGARFLASTNIQSGLALGVIPLAAATLLLIWWLAASRAPKFDRLAGLVLFLAGLAAVVFSQKSRGMGAMLLALALPAMIYGAVVALLVTYRLGWSARRWVVAACVLLCAGVFCAKRVDSIGGNLAPIVAWRWSPTVLERSEALRVSGVQGTALLPAEASPEDWPAFRGAARDGRVVGVKLPPGWGAPPKELWRRRIGAAWSSFAAVGDYVFTQEQRGEDELVTCYHAATGELVWVNRTPARFEDSMGLGPRATPAFDRGKLYTQGGTGVLQCLDAATGVTLWKRDLAKDTDTRVPRYGFSSSPLVLGERVIVFSCAAEGRTAIAYHRASGKVLWSAGHKTVVHSSPHYAVLAEIPQILMVCDYGLQSFNPATGALLWDHHWKVDNYPRCVQPLIVDQDLVMLGTTGTMGSRLLRISRSSEVWDVKEEWFTRKFRPYFNDGVLHQGHDYGFDGERLACLDLKTGERRWEGKLYGGQLVLLVDAGLLLILNESGEVVLVPATPGAFSEQARFKALSGKTWNHPVVAHRKLYLRNAEEAACFELPKP